MILTINLSQPDRDLLYEISDWIYLENYDNRHLDCIYMKTCAERICRALYSGDDNYEIERRDLKNIRGAFSDFRNANPEKSQPSRELQHKLTELINEAEQDKEAME